MYSPKNIDPINLEKSTSIGISLPFNKRVIFTPTFFTRDSIKANIINYLLTNPGERYMNNGFGSGIREFLFQNIEGEYDSALISLKQKLRSDIDQYFRDVKIDDIVCNFDQAKHKLNIGIFFRITSTGERNKILLTL